MAAGWVAVALKQVTSHDDTHPSLADRHEGHGRTRGIRSRTGRVRGETPGRDRSSNLTHPGTSGLHERKPDPISLRRYVGGQRAGERPDRSPVRRKHRLFGASRLIQWAIATHISRCCARQSQATEPPSRRWKAAAPYSSSPTFGLSILVGRASCWMPIPHCLPL
jgi:hypothetical protein